MMTSIEAKTFENIKINVSEVIIMYTVLGILLWQRVSDESCKFIAGYSSEHVTQPEKIP